MKCVSKSLGLALLLVAAQYAQAFHEGGVASCSMCHIMHRGVDGFDIQPSLENNFLLLSNSPTEMCLSCHAMDYGSVWATNPLQPAPERGGGNFIFGSAANINDAPNGNLFPLTGSHGIHNCVAASQNVIQDPVHSFGPGGNYPSASLGCTSCHDPHGNTNFRMLRGVGEVPAGQFNFIYPAPLAEGIPLNGPAESRTLHTAYISGWSNWCANCHGFYHDNSLTGFEHPVDGRLNGKIRRSYDLYDGSGNPQGGNPATAYLPDVPYEDPSMTTTTTNGPNPASRIACISCHRAHGSSAVDLGRWDFRVNNMRLDGVVSGSYAIPSPYVDVTIERQLCVKCHEQDTRTHGFNQACISCHREHLIQKPGPAERRQLQTR